MKLSPLDIKRHSFEKGFRGYDPAEVDGFLKQIADQFESLQEELRLAHERTRDTESKLQHYERVEMALQEALESAKASAQRSEEDATRRAAVIVEEAELRAQQIVQDAERERFGMKQDLVRLSSRQAEVAARLKGFLLSELEVLTDFQGSAPAGLLQLEASDPLQLTSGDRDDDAGTHAADAPSQEHVDIPAEEVHADAEPRDATEAPDAPATTRSAPEPLPETDERLSDDHSANVESTTPYSPYAPPESGAPPVEISSRAHEDALPPDDSEVLGPPTPVDADVPLSSGGWTAPETNVAGSEAERERIRRILEDLD